MLALVICCMLLVSNVAIVRASSVSAAAHHADAPSWLVNWPDHFRREAVQDSSALVDVKDDSDEMMAQGLLVKREVRTSLCVSMFVGMFYFVSLSLYLSFFLRSMCDFLHISECISIHILQGYTY